MSVLDVVRDSCKYLSCWRRQQSKTNLKESLICESTVRNNTEGCFFLCLFDHVSKHLQEQLQFMMKPLIDSGLFMDMSKHYISLFCNFLRFSFHFCLRRCHAYSLVRFRHKSNKNWATLMFWPEIRFFLFFPFTTESLKLSRRLLKNIKRCHAYKS